MDQEILEFYRLPNISECEDFSLLTLSENCAALEEKVLKMAKALSEEDYLLLEEYILMRNDLEVETFKVALRWGKRHLK